MPFSYRSGWIIALALAIVFAGLAQPRTNKDGSKRSHTVRFMLIVVGLALLSYTLYGCSITDSLI